jgi:hypothetical protein
MSTLDSAGVPNTVLPGNHDMDVATGDAPEYRQEFPPSRYAAAGWNSPAARYGGYLGQNLFGPDPVDRGNMDSFALFTAGGLDFLLLNLEFDPPDHVLDWAKKVLAAYPQRRAILATHSYVNTSGQIVANVQRPGGNTAAQVWQKLVSPSCSIFLVVNGHFHDGDLSEARRTDTNSCGRPVHAVLSDYQERVNGGDGWLRYYTFSPARNEIRAVTYSPTLGRYETDADSAFTLPYDMSLPAGFTEVGRTTVPAGTTASVPVPTLPAGTGYQWYATASDGTTTATSPTWSFTTAATPPPAVYAQDSFSRTVTGGWGAAEVGGGWQLTGATRASVAGGVAAQGVPAGVTALATLPGIASTATELTVTVALDAVPNGPVYLTSAVRRVAAGDYGGRLKVNPNGSVELHTTTPTGLLGGGVLPGITLAAGQQLQLRVQAEGVNPTTVRARAWRVGSTEPAGWAVTSTDSTPALQVAGTVGLTTYLSSSATNGPATVRYDDVRAVPVGAAPPPPPAALAADGFGRSVTGGWGAADTGGTWSTTGGAARFSVAGGAGQQAVAAGVTTGATLPVTATGTDTTVRLSLDTLPNGPVYTWVHGRKVGGYDYAAKAKVLAGGAVELTLTRSGPGLDGTPLAGGLLPGVTLAAGQPLSIRVQVLGTGPTTLRAKAWLDGAEPAAWSATATDGTAALQAAGAVGLTTYLSSAVTSGPVTARWDDLSVTPV